MKKLAILLAVLWTFGPPGPGLRASQDALTTIEGAVLRRDTNDPIPDVRVTAVRANPAGPIRTTPEGKGSGGDGPGLGLGVGLESPNRNPSQAAPEGKAAVSPGPPSASAPLTAVTDASGHFVIRNVPLGSIS